MNERKCIGFGEHEGRCHNTAGTPWSPYWCGRCNELRMARISAILDQLLAESERRRAP